MLFVVAVFSMTIAGGISFGATYMYAARGNSSLLLAAESSQKAEHPCRVE